MPLYTYKNPNTGELFESISTIDNRDNPVVLEDGTKCYRVPFPPTKRGGAIINKNREVFEADPDYVKKCNPKYVQYQDGHKERYDPTRHC